jgi:hypothetical protein
MSDSHHDDYSICDEALRPVAHTIAAAEAIREAASRMQLARDVSEQLDVHNLAAVGTALEDITRGLEQFAGQIAGALPDSVDQHLTASQEISDGLVAFRISVLDASIAARSLGSSATSVSNSAVPHQRRASTGRVTGSATDPDQAFLHHAGDQPAIPTEEPSGGQPSSSRRRR